MTTHQAFKAVTWNVEYTTPPHVLRPILKDVLANGVSVLLLQEVTQPAVLQMFRAHGLKMSYVGPRYAVAWTDRWVGRDRHAVDLADSTYRRRLGQTVRTRGAAVTLQDGKTGPTVDVLSYQLPSSVQTAHPLPGRLAVTRDAMATMRELRKDSKADACLFGGDDNVDERLLHGPWGFMLEKATGLKLVQAPSATHGGGRRIDDFRIHGLHAGHGWTQKGGGDHRLHGRVFQWA